jgi:hypothetical protein
LASWKPAGNDYQSTDGFCGKAMLRAEMLPTVENEKLKPQEPAIPVIIWIYISYVFSQVKLLSFQAPFS